MTYGYSSGKYGVAPDPSLLEDGILCLKLCQSAVSSAKCELCNFKFCRVEGMAKVV